MADGVDAYTVLGTHEGADRAFEKPDTIEKQRPVGGRRPGAAAPGLGRRGDDDGPEQPNP